MNTCTSSIFTSTSILLIYQGGERRRREVHILLVIISRIRSYKANIATEKSVEPKFDVVSKIDVEFRHIPTMRTVGRGS